MDKFVITESERKEINSLIEEFKQKGGMSTEELISRLDAIPFEDFMNNMSKRIREYGKENNKSKRYNGKE